MFNRFGRSASFKVSPVSMALFVDDDDFIHDGTPGFLQARTQTSEALDPHQLGQQEKASPKRGSQLGRVLINPDCPLLAEEEIWPDWREYLQMTPS